MAYSCSLRHVMVFTVPVIQIFIWATLMNVIYFSAIHTWPHVLEPHLKHFGFGPRTAKLTAYIALTSVLIFYPIGGFLGDVCFGRYKAVLLSLIVITVVMVTTGTGSLLLYKGHGTAAIILLVASFLLFVVSLSIYKSNILQFGLDQLMDKPSESLGVFVHWLVWTITFGELISNIFFALHYCNTRQKAIFRIILYTMPVSFLILLVLCLILSYCTRHRFNKDRVKYNPYKLIYKVLNFARKNKYPVGPVSAFTRCYNFRPSRLDYAKERYGGPFTTSDVEDVKSFKNVFLILLALGPVYVADPPMQSFIFHMFSNHTGAMISFGTSNETCENIETIFSRIGVLIGFPIYMWVIYSVFRNRTPRILYRLISAISIYLLAVTSILVADFTGHLILYTRSHNHTEYQAGCMFVEHELQETLHLHWAVIAIPSFIGGISHDVVIASALEFISAQSPHAMKGVLVGIFFATIGIFRVIGAIFFIPFSLKVIWKYGYLGKHPPVISCGFGYYLVCITVALIGLGSLIVAVKRYKYRRRDEEPYSQACVEEIFARRLANRAVSYDRQGYQELSGSNINS